MSVGTGQFRIGARQIVPLGVEEEVGAGWAYKDVVDTLESVARDEQASIDWSRVEFKAYRLNYDETDDDGNVIAPAGTLMVLVTAIAERARENVRPEEGQ